MPNNLIIKIQTFENLDSWEIGRGLLDRVFAIEKLKPQRVANFGEVTAKYGLDVEGLDECKAQWGAKASMRIDGAPRDILEDFNWKRSRVCKSLGRVDFPNTNMKGFSVSGGIYFEANFRTEIDWTSLFSDWCKISCAYGGILHPAMNIDGPKKNKQESVNFSLDDEIAQKSWSRFLGGTLQCDFRAGELNSLFSGLTNLGWATWFSADLAKEVDAKKIAQSDFPIEKIGEGYLIKVTESIEDVIEDFEKFSQRRAKLKSLFRDDLFLIKDEP